jgi:hypothetical protein
MKISNLKSQISNHQADTPPAGRSGPGRRLDPGGSSPALVVRFILLSCFLCLRAPAQYSIDWHKVSGGGGTSTNGSYALSGTIGQPDAGGPMTSGNSVLTGGFWTIYALQSPGAPTLHITHAGGSVTVFWQAVSGWSLQQNNDLASPTGWLASAGVTTSDGTNYLTIAPPAGNGYFRLYHP